MADLPEENIQAIMMAILKNIERSLLNVEESTNKLCSPTRSPQGGLDLECHIPDNDCIGGLMNKASPMEKPILPLLKTMKEGKNKEDARAHQWLLRESELPDFLLVNSGGQCEPITEWSLKNPQASAVLSLQAPLNMINLKCAEKGKGKATWEVKAERRPTDRPMVGTIRVPDKTKATIVRGVVLCSRCHFEYELEVPTTGAIIDQELVKRREREEQEKRIKVMRSREKEASQNVFQRLGGDSQPKNLSEVFRNYEALEEVEDKEAKIPRWKEAKPPQPSYADGHVRMKGRTVDPVTKRNLGRLGRRWFIVGKDGKPVKEMRASMIRRVQRQHKAHMNSLKAPATSETSGNIKLEDVPHGEGNQPYWKSKREVKKMSSKNEGEENMCRQALILGSTES